ncbi:MAG: hypothetical protein AAB518_02560 [Patescibacteria group bacterium]
MTYLILLVATIGVGIIEFALGVKNSVSFSIAGLVLLACTSTALILYKRGFWVIAGKYRQQALQTGTGMLIVLIIVSFALQLLVTFKSFNQESVVEPNVGVGVGMLLGGLAIIWLMAAAYIVFGIGLKKLSATMGDRAKTLGNLFFWSGIATAVIIGIPVALILWIVAYFLSFKFFKEELDRTKV